MPWTVAITTTACLFVPGLREQIRGVCHEEYLVCGEGDETGATWMEKVLQLYQISQLNHGLMMVGPSGSGKSAAWRVLLKALQRLEGTEGVAHVIDPKASCFCRWFRRGPDKETVAALAAAARFPVRSLVWRDVIVDRRPMGGRVMRLAASCASISSRIELQSYEWRLKCN